MKSTILYVEDNSDIRDITSVILTKAGYNVITSPNGKDGLDLCKKQHFDMIVTDILMPVMDGNEFIKKVSGLKYVPPIVALSYRDSDVAPNHHITTVALKPLTSRELVQTINAAFTKNQAKLEMGAA